jgi:hypothetical protein
MKAVLGAFLRESVSEFNMQWWWVRTVSREGGVDEMASAAWDRTHEGKTVCAFSLHWGTVSYFCVGVILSSNLDSPPVQQPPSSSGFPSSAVLGPGQSLMSDAGHDLQKSDTPTNCLSSSSLGMTASGV